MTGFATKTSVNAGESLPVKLNVYGHGGATTVDLQIFRLGYYGGAGGRLIATQTGIPVTDQGFLPPTDALGYTTAAAAWNPTVTINTTGYETGMYLIKIVANPADFAGLAQREPHPLHRARRWPRPRPVGGDAHQHLAGLQRLGGQVDLRLQLERGPDSDRSEGGTTRTSAPPRSPSIGP